MCCAKEVESETHALFLCKRVRNVWIGTFPSIMELVDLYLSLHDMLSLVADKLNTNGCLLFGVSCWAIWEDRNQMLHRIKVDSPFAFQV